MMEIKLSWDIVFVGLFIVIFGITFLRPHKFSLRLLLGTYLSLLTAEGGSFFLEKVILPAAPELQSWVSEKELLVFMCVRLILFGIAMILFLSRAHYHIEHKAHTHWLARSIIHLVFSVLISLLIVSSIFAFLSGNSVIDAALGTFIPNDWFDNTLFVLPILNIFGLWLVLPAISMIIISVIGPRE